MSLLLGKSNNNEFNCEFKKYVLNFDKGRNKVEWMQAFPYDWHSVLKDLFHENEDSNLHVEVDVRINFTFNKTKYLHSKENLVDKNIKIIPTSKADFENMQGSVLPKFFWNDFDKFITQGKGYSLYHENNLAAIAFSSTIDDKTLELGIETQEQFRGKGFAYKVCSSLIDYCLTNNIEPFWACKLTNTGSCKLAQKLGFEELISTPYYKLNC